MASDYARKIRALLAKAEGTTNPHERDAYQVQAERLMVKWGIDDAMLADADPSLDEVKVEFLDMQHIQPVQGWGLLMMSLGVGLGNVRVFMSDYSGETKTVVVYLVGFKRDIERYKILWESVYVQANAALEAYWQHYLDRLQADQAVTRMVTTSTQIQFLASYGNAVGDRLRTERLLAQEATIGSDLVIIGREKEVDDFVNANTQQVEIPVPIFPDLSAQTAGWIGGVQANISGHEEVEHGR